jgi:hypothetical protein
MENRRNPCWSPRSSCEKPVKSWGECQGLVLVIEKEYHRILEQKLGDIHHGLTLLGHERPPVLSWWVWPVKELG